MGARGPDAPFAARRDEAVIDFFGLDTLPGVMVHETGSAVGCALG